METTYEDDYKFPSNGAKSFMMMPSCEEKLVNDGGGVEDEQDQSELEQFSALTTLMCADRLVDDVCQVIGNLSAKWGYLERETICLVSRRLEIFFHNSENAALGLFVLFVSCKN